MPYRRWTELTGKQQAQALALIEPPGCHPSNRPNPPKTTWYVKKDGTVDSWLVGPYFTGAKRLTETDNNGRRKMTTIREAKARRVADLVSITQTLIRLRGPHDDQAIVNAIDLAVDDVARMVPMTDNEHAQVREELVVRYGVAA